jgi:tetratricopeptide (TPR) repeat protein
VAEKPEIAEAGAETPGPDPAAIAVALGVASRERADTFLEEQTRLVRLQAEELSHELNVRRWSLWVRHLSGLLKLTFEIGLAVVALGVACFIAAAVWNAAHSEGTVIESFSVPPDMAARGLTGQVVASQMLDQLTAMQKITQSARTGRPYASGWGDDLKVEIPETGVSIGEAYRFLRRWLGNETHVSGELVRTPAGVAITTRVDGNSGATVRGSESDLDALLVQSAEHVYRVAQPDRYARYIFFPRPGLTKPRFEEARAILNQAAREAVPAERAWAWIGLGVLGRYRSDFRAASIAYRNVTSMTSFPLTIGPAVVEAEISHPEYALSWAQTFRQDRNSLDGIDPNFVVGIRNTRRHLIAFLQSDYQSAAAAAQTGIRLGGGFSLSGSDEYRNKLMEALSLLHDGIGVRATWNSLPPLDTPADNARRAIARVVAEGELGHFQAVVALGPDAEKTASAVGETFAAKDALEIHLRPLLALAKARTGDIAGAQALIAASPLDCYDCLRIRALIAAEAKQPKQADDWFARAIRDAPSIPRAYADWGKVLLERGQPDAAIAKFRQANERGPHFADPLEGWGEALMAKNQSHRALAKFAQANQYAPSWGRLHLKWGEALVYAGKKDEARKQFARAAQLDLAPAEKSELARFNRV